MEHLLHYLWKHKIFPLQELRTTDGQEVEVIDPGLPNTDAGPDFFNAKLKLDGILWVGNVELHDRSSLWLKHGHQSDAAYDNVILHVVSEADCPVFRRDGQPIPQLVLACPADVARRYDELRSSEIHNPFLALCLAGRALRAEGARHPCPSRCVRQSLGGRVLRYLGAKLWVRAEQ